jgi:tRNA(adenine34) deaminase
MTHKYFMNEALKEAKRAYRRGDVPVGAVAVKGGKIIARGSDKKESKKDPTAHAEIECLKKASREIRDWRLSNVVLYSTLEPCYMCAGALLNSRVKQLIYGTKNHRTGGSNLLKGKVKVKKGILKEDCQKLLKAFFEGLRRGVRAA